MLISKLFRKPTTPEPQESPESPDIPTAPCVLNVGGNNKAISIPEHYAGWDHLLLDIDPACNPDILSDARELHCLEAEQFDAVYCSHNLEHYYKHEVRRVLLGFLHVLKPEGFAEIIVPDLMAVMHRVINEQLDIEDTLYFCAAGPITARDVFYGWSKEIEESGQDFFAHKTGFSPASLKTALETAGFRRTFIFPEPDQLQVRALVFKSDPTPDQARFLALPT